MQKLHPTKVRSEGRQRRFGSARQPVAAGLRPGQVLLAVWLCCASLTALAQSPAPTPTPAAQIEVTGFQVSGNTLLAPALVEAVLQPFKGRRSLEELQSAANALQRLYAQQGFGGVVALIPPQTPRDGQVQIHVVEGKLAKVSIEGAKRTPQTQVLASLPALVPGQTPRMRELDLQLQMANESAARRTELLLKPGQRSGEIDAAVTVAEAPLQRWSLDVDSSGSASTGRVRVGLSWRHADISGADDLLSVQGLTSLQKPDAVKVFSLGYRRPLYRWTTTLEAFFSSSDVDGGSTPTAVGNLLFNGRGRLAGVRATRLLPRQGEMDQRLIFGLDRRDYLNQCAIAGLPAGACGAAGESITVQPLVLEYALRSGGAMPWSLSASLHHNLRLGGARTSAADFAAVRAGAKPRYSALRMNGSVGQTVFEDWSLQARMALQWTDDALVPGEQFGLGGGGMLRGYDEREVTGDRGAFASLELSTPSLGIAALPDLRLSVFAEAGSLSSLKGAQCLAGRSECHLASVGVAARAGDAQTHLQVSIGQPLRDAARTEKNKPRLHAALNHQF